MKSLGRFSGFPLAMNGSFLPGAGPLLDGFGWWNRLQETVTDSTRRHRTPAASAANTRRARKERLECEVSEMNVSSHLTASGRSYWCQQEA